MPSVLHLAPVILGGSCHALKHVGKCLHSGTLYIGALPPDRGVTGAKMRGFGCIFVEFAFFIFSHQSSGSSPASL